MLNCNFFNGACNYVRTSKLLKPIPATVGERGTQG